MKMQTQIVKYNFPLSGMPQKAADILTADCIKNAHDIEMGCAVVVKITDTTHVNKVADVAAIYGGYAVNDAPTQWDLDKLNNSK